LKKESNNSSSPISRSFKRMALWSIISIAALYPMYELGWLDWYIRIKEAILPSTIFYLPSFLLDGLTGGAITLITDIIGQYLNAGRISRLKQSCIIGASGVLGGFGSHVLVNWLSLSAPDWFSLWLPQMVLEVSLFGLGSLILLGAYIGVAWWARKVCGIKDKKGVFLGKAAKIVGIKIIFFGVQMVLFSFLPYAAKIIGMQIWMYIAMVAVAYIMNHDKVALAAAKGVLGDAPREEHGKKPSSSPVEERNLDLALASIID
jgi:hypothetical protein